MRTPLEIVVAERDEAQAEVHLLRAQIADIEKVVREHICPTANSEGCDDLTSAYVCLDEDGDPIIEADTLAEVVRDTVRCWTFEHERAERLRAQLLAARADLEESAGWRDVDRKSIRAEAFEEAAKIADAYTTPNESGHDGKCYCRGCMARHEIAAAIRKLKGASHA